jgi:hypothetical protein
VFGCCGRRRLDRSRRARRLLLTVVLAVTVACALLGWWASPAQAAEAGLQVPVQPSLASAKEQSSVVLAGVPDWLARVNMLRAMSGLAPVAENTSWSYGCWLHSRYMYYNGMTHYEDSSKPYYTVAGAEAGSHSNVLSGTGGVTAIDWWMMAPFHGVGIIDPRLSAVGFDDYPDTYPNKATLDVLHGLGSLPSGTVFPVFWPGPGSVCPFVAYYGGESPDPLSGTGYTTPSGLPLIVQFGQVPVVTHSGLVTGTQELEHVCVTEQTYTNADPSAQSLGRAVLAMRRAVIVIPRYPLERSKTYTVSLTVNGSAYDCTFSTQGPPTITGLDPTSGFTTGGTVVAITGTGFAGATSVDFGGKAATYTVDSATQITATVPAHAAGPVQVRVSSPAGASADAPADDFTYLAPTRYQQDYADFTYMGPWVTSATNWLLSGGTFAYVDTPGSSANVTFEGTYLEWFAKKGPGYGKAQVSLDGGAPVSVDLYAAYDQYKKQVYNTGLLTDTPHTLSIYWTGQKNPASLGTAIDVDTFDIYGTVGKAPAAPPLAWRYQQTDTRLAYLGAWSTGTTWSASGGSYYSTGASGAAVVAKFTGTSINVIAKTAPWYGEAVVTLDGSDQTVDFYSATQLFKQNVYQKTGLSPGEHTLTIRPAGTKSLASSGYSVGLDALDLEGYLLQASTRYQQDVAGVGYAGTWSTGYTWSASGGSYVSGAGSAAQVTVTFTGRSLAWVAKTCPWYGRAQVTLDGGPPVTVDLYSAGITWKKRVYETGLLPGEGPHTLVIKWLGTKYWRSVGTAICVDAFDLLGAMAP